MASAESQGQREAELVRFVGKTVNREPQVLLQKTVGQQVLRLTALPHEAGRAHSPVPVLRAPTTGNLGRNRLCGGALEWTELPSGKRQRRSFCWGSV